MNDKACSVIASVLATIGLSLSVGELQQMISLIATCFSFGMNIIILIIIPFVKKIKSALSDGKLTIDEVEDIAKDTKNNIDKINKLK